MLRRILRNVYKLCLTPGKLTQIGYHDASLLTCISHLKVISQNWPRVCLQWLPSASLCHIQDGWLLQFSFSWYTATFVRFSGVCLSDARPLTSTLTPPPLWIAAPDAGNRRLLLHSFLSLRRSYVMASAEDSNLDSKFDIHKTLKFNRKIVKREWAWCRNYARM